jgi:hypothetical protein
VGSRLMDSGGVVGMFGGVLGRIVRHGRIEVSLRVVDGWGARWQAVKAGEEKCLKGRLGDEGGHGEGSLPEVVIGSSAVVVECWLAARRKRGRCRCAASLADGRNMVVRSPQQHSGSRQTEPLDQVCLGLLGWFAVIKFKANCHFRSACKACRQGRAARRSQARDRFTHSRRTIAEG